MKLNRKRGMTRMPFITVYPTFNIYLEDLVKNCFQNLGGLIVRRRGRKCIRFAADMILLGEEEIILKNMLIGAK